MLYVYIMDDHNKYSCPQNGIIRGQNVEKGYTLMLISKSKLSSFTVQILFAKKIRKLHKITFYFTFTFTFTFIGISGEN